NYTADRVVQAPVPPRPSAADQKSQLRMRLLEQLNGVMITRDTPRGLTVVLNDYAFRGNTLAPGTPDGLARVAAVVKLQPGLRVEVFGHSDTHANEPISWSRAEAVRTALLAQGLPPGAVSARGLGATRPEASNATAAGRLENRRVEVVISGDPIGTL